MAASSPDDIGWIITIARKVGREVQIDFGRCDDRIKVIQLVAENTLRSFSPRLVLFNRLSGAASLTGVATVFGHCLNPTANMHLVADVLDVSTDGFGADIQFIGDFLVDEP